MQKAEMHGTVVYSARNTRFARVCFHSFPAIRDIRPDGRFLYLTKLTRKSSRGHGIYTIWDTAWDLGREKYLVIFHSKKM